MADDLGMQEEAVQNPPTSGELDSQPVSGRGPAARRRKRPARLALMVVLVLLIGSPGSLWLVGERALGQVTVTTGVPECTGTEVGTARSDDGFLRQAIPMTQDARCIVMLRVSNASDAEVSLIELLVPVFGPGGGAGMRITRIAGEEVAKDREIDALMTLDETVSSGSAYIVELTMIFRPSGCASPRGQMGTYPVLTVRRLLATRELVVADFPFFIGTTDTSCDT